MTSEARVIGFELLKTGTLVSFRVVTEEVLNAPADDAEFGLRGAVEVRRGRQKRKATRTT